MIKKIFVCLLFIFSLFFTEPVLATEVVYYPIDCIWGADCNTLYSCDGSTTYVGTGNNNDNYSSLHYDAIPIFASDINSWEFCVQGTGSLNTGPNSNARCFELNGSSSLHEYCCTTGLSQDSQSFQNMKDYMSLYYWFNQNAGVTNNDTLDCAYYKINYNSATPTPIPTNTPTPTNAPTPTPTNTPTPTEAPTPTNTPIPSPILTPVPTSTPIAGASAPVCNDQKPDSAPSGLTAIADFNSVTLTWNKASNPVSYYLVTYGTSQGSQTYGNPNIGNSSTTSYTVTNLSGGFTYYFKVRAGNGCAPGEFSNEVSAAPSGGFVAGVPEEFAAGVLGAATGPSSQPSPTKSIIKIGQVKAAITRNFSKYIFLAIITTILSGVVWLFRKKFLKK